MWLIEHRLTLKRIWCWLMHKRLHSPIIDTSARIQESGICGWRCISCLTHYMLNSPNRTRLTDGGCI